MDFKQGRLIGVVNFESRFHVTTILWASDLVLYGGCNNGVLFIIHFNPTAEQPILMRPILKPFNAPITALALDPIQSFLAVGSAGDTFIFSRPAYADLKSWDFIDHIPAPSEKQGRLVHTHGFFGVGTRDRQLFIGYAKEGFRQAMSRADKLGFD
ncbi:hypothetical protein FRC07_002963 [Ceratobasidium sp. 392]|nr:hypothetical protein FRC07_002963 [Ceratobasidium sp. 392]